MGSWVHRKCSKFKNYKPVGCGLCNNDRWRSIATSGLPNKENPAGRRKARMRIRCIIWPKTNRTAKYGSSPIMHSLEIFFWEVKTNSSKKNIFIQKIDETEVIVYMVSPKVDLCDHTIIFFRW